MKFNCFQMSESINDKNALTSRETTNGGLRKSIISSIPINYVAKDGFHTIDNTLKQTRQNDQCVWQNVTSPMIVSFPETTGENRLVSVKYNNNALSWVLVGARHVQSIVKNNADSGKPDSLTSEITYPDILPDTDIRFTLYGLCCKEDIVIRKRPAADGIAVTMKGTSLRFVRNKDNSIDVYTNDGTDKESVPVFTLPAPTAHDSSEGDAVSVDYDMTETAEGVTLTYRLDAAWLDSAVYPVTIDPTVIVSGHDNAEALYMMRGDATPHTTDIRTGFSSSGNEYVSLIRFTELAALEPGDTVVQAKLRLYPGSAAHVNPLYVGAYAPGANWNASNMTWDDMDNWVEQI